MLSPKNILWAGIGGAIVYLMYRKALAAEQPIPVIKERNPVLSIDWQKTYDQAMIKCSQGDEKACKSAEFALSRGAKAPETPSGLVDPARDNAFLQCNNGDVKACCWLKTARNETPPKPCVPPVDGSDNLNGYYWY